MSDHHHSPYGEEEHLRERVRQLAQGLRARLSEITASEYPNETPQLLVRILENIAEKAVATGEKSGTSVLQMIAVLLMSYGRLLSYLDNARTEQTPRALTGMLEWIYKQLGSDPTLLACPQAEYNYSIFDVLQYLKGSSKNLLSEADRQRIFGAIPSIQLIAFPRIERDNVVLHSIFGHEIGHPYADEFLNDEEFGSRKTAFQASLKVMTRRVEDELREDIKQTEAFPFRFDAKTAFIGQILEIRRRGLQELLSDAVAVHIFGPSAIFAAYEIFMPAGLDTSPTLDDWYPPNRYRLRLMIDVADKLGHLDAVRAAAPETVSVVDHLVALASSDQDTKAITAVPIVRLAYEWIAQVLTDAVPFVLEKTRTAAYGQEQISKEVSRLVDRLVLGIPPGELGPATSATRVDWRSSILAAWVCRVRGLGNTDIDVLRMLMCTRKAIEYVLLRESFQEHLGN